MMIRIRKAEWKDIDVIDQTIALKEKLGADAIRDCDGTEMPKELLDFLKPLLVLKQTFF